MTTHRLTLASTAVLTALTLVALSLSRAAHAGPSDYDAMVEKHARANHVPATLVHRVIQRESKYHPELVGRGGTIGLMQIKVDTARSLGYTGDAKGLRDPETNLTYGVKYLAGAYRAAAGDLARAMHYYAAGYYQAAKRLRLELAEGKRSEANGNPQPPLSGDALPKRPRKVATFASVRISRPLSIVPAGTKAKSNSAALTRKSNGLH